MPIHSKRIDEGRHPTSRQQDEQNLKDAFAGESQANRRYLCSPEGGRGKCRHVFARPPGRTGHAGISNTSKRLGRRPPIGPTDGRS
jgi:hypothetical protein